MNGMTMNWTTKLVLCALLVASAFVSFASEAGAQSHGSMKDTIVFRRAAVTLHAERADSPEKRAQGLMYRPSLAQDDGMIFYFEENARHTFWMHNTRMPLTVIFLNENLQIVDMQDMTPCLQINAELCRTHTSKNPARYAIEVNQGFVAKHGIILGDYVTIRSGT
jgi:uncharacterized protein